MVCIKSIYDSMLVWTSLSKFVNLHYESNLCCELNLCALSICMFIVVSLSTSKIKVISHFVVKSKLS
jgi:hypothetical protein